MTKKAHTISAIAVPTVMSCVNMLTIGPVSTAAQGLLIDSKFDSGNPPSPSRVQGRQSPSRPWGVPLPSLAFRRTLSAGSYSAQLLELAIIRRPIRAPSQERRGLPEPPTVVDQADAHLTHNLDRHRPPWWNSVVLPA